MNRRAFLSIAIAATMLAVAPARAADDISPADAYSKIQADPSIIVLDIRTSREFAAGHIESAINMDFYAADFAERVAELDPSRTYVMHCASGGRSDAALSVFENAGITNLLHMDRGFRAWQRAGLPMVR